MKKVLFSVLLALPFLLGACSSWGDSDYSPTIYTSVFYLHPVDTAMHVDTLHVIASPNILDTISVGDTVQFNVQINAMTSNLVSFQFTQLDTSALAASLLLSSDFMTALSDSSSVEDCYLRFKEGYVGAGFGVRYIAKKVGVHEVTMQVTSTSKYSTSYITFTQPVF